MPQLLPTARPRRRRHRIGLVLAGGIVIAASAIPAPAAAADPQEFAADQACPGFPVRLAGDGEVLRTREFTRRNGDVVTITTGRGSDTTVTNLDTGASVDLASGPVIITSTYHPRTKTTDLVLIGPNVVVLFPSDVPAGPSTTLHTGVVAYAIDANGVWTQVDRLTHGRTRDLCAEIA